jgi:hypothetical protein
LHTANAGFAEGRVGLQNNSTRQIRLPLTETALPLATDISVTGKIGQDEALRLLAIAAQPVLSIEA